MTTPELTLQNVKEKATKVREHKASDFLTDEQIAEVHESNIKGKKNTKFDNIDAYIAEILARFGYETYKAWNNGEISQEKMAKYIQAERVRETQTRFTMELIVAGANSHTVQASRMVKSILKQEQKIARQGG